MYGIDWVATGQMLLVVITAIYVWLTNKAIEETRKARIEEGSPQIVLYFELDRAHPNLIYLVLENYGRRPGYHVTLSSSPPLVSPDGTAARFVSEGVQFLPPGQTLRTLFGTSFEVLDESNPVPLDYEVEIAYGDGRDGMGYGHKDTLSLRDFQDIIWTPSSVEYSLERIGKELESLRTALERH